MSQNISNHWNKESPPSLSYKDCQGSYGSMPEPPWRSRHFFNHYESPCINKLQIIVAVVQPNYYVTPNSQFGKVIWRFPLIDFVTIKLWNTAWLLPALTLLPSFVWNFWGTPRILENAIEELNNTFLMGVKNFFQIKSITQIWFGLYPLWHNGLFRGV